MRTNPIQYVRDPWFWRWAIIFIALLMLWGCSRIEEEIPGVEESLTISGSASALPIVEDLAAAYEDENPQAKIHFLPSVHSSGGVFGVLDGTLDIGVVSRNLNQDEETNPVYRYPFARDMLVFATHPDAKVRDVSTQDIIEIYSGRVTNWKELGGIDQDIVVLDRPAHTSAKQVLHRTLFSESFHVTPKALVLERPDQVGESLLSIPGSIGYTAYSDLFSRIRHIPMLSLDGVMPVLENSPYVKNRFYRTYTFVFKSPPEGLSKRFIDFVYSPSGQKIILAKGLNPEHRKFVLALLPAINIVEQETRYRPLVDYLSRKSGIPIEVEYTTSYEEVVREFSNKDFDGAFLGSFAYALVHNKVPLEVLGRPEINSQTFYTGIFFVRHDSRIQEFEDLRGKTFCFVDKATTAGYLFPLIYLKERGVDRPEDFFGKILFSGTHDASILSVFNGDADAGVAKDLVLMKMGEKNPRIALELIMVDASLPVPTNGLSVRKNLDPDIKEVMGKVILSMDQDPEGKAVLKHFGANRFVPTQHKDYHNLYTMIDTLEIDLDHFLAHSAPQDGRVESNISVMEAETENRI